MTASNSAASAPVFVAQRINVPATAAAATTTSAYSAVACPDCSLMTLLIAAPVEPGIRPGAVGSVRSQRQAGKTIEDCWRHRQEKKPGKDQQRQREEHQHRESPHRFELRSSHLCFEFYG